MKLPSAEELLSLITSTAGLYQRDRIAMVNTFRNKVLEAAAEALFDRADEHLKNHHGGRAKETQENALLVRKLKED